MRISIKIRFDSKLPKFEKVFDNKYILYLPFQQNNDSQKKIIEIISKKLGVIPENIYFVMIGKNDECIFDLDV